MPFQPVPEERYRIQNVDFKTYLEVRGLESGSAVVMRPKKQVDKQMVIESNIPLTFWGSTANSGLSSP